jgi:hypothetical protein
MDFTENDAENGETLKDSIVSLLKEQNIILKEKHEGLQSKNMPTIENLCEDEGHFKLIIKYDARSYEINVPKIEPGVLRASLCWMYGYGLVKYDYELPVFQGLEKDVLERYQRFAVQIWERNIHRDWMQKNRKYKHHNGDLSKGAKFVYGVSSKDRDERWAAILEHRRITDAEEEGETPHHIFRYPKRLKKLIMTEGENEIEHKLLVESIYDQATATTRRWLRKDDNRPFEERLFENMKKGYFIKRGEKRKPEKRWKPGFFGFTNDYETKMWGIWVEAHKEFRDYWTTKFGKNEEFWQPPAP